MGYRLGTESSCERVWMEWHLLAAEIKSSQAATTTTKNTLKISRISHCKGFSRPLVWSVSFDGTNKFDVMALIGAELWQRKTYPISEL